MLTALKSSLSQKKVCRSAQRATTCVNLATATANTTLWATREVRAFKRFNELVISMVGHMWLRYASVCVCVFSRGLFISGSSKVD